MASSLKFPCGAPFACDGVAVGVTVGDGEGVIVGFGVPVAVGVCVGVGRGVAVGRGVGVGVGVRCGGGVANPQLNSAIIAVDDKIKFPGVSFIGLLSEFQPTHQERPLFLMSRCRFRLPLARA